MSNQEKAKAYWTQKTHLFAADEYICSSCKYASDKAYPQCPRCGKQMNRSKYDPSWVDEAEILDTFL